MTGSSLDLGDARAVVMGLGRFGGGLGVTRWLASQGARVLVTDKLDADALAAPLRALDDLVNSGQVTLRLGEHLKEDFSACDLLIANPAVPAPWDNPYIQTARDAGAIVSTEIALLVQRLPDRRRVVGVTGSAGKSTTASMIACALRGSGTAAHLGGNIGGSLLLDLDRIALADPVVLELSSAQLHWLGEALPRWSPGVAVVTSLAPNHIDWHGSIDHYRTSKHRLTLGQQPGDTAILGADLEGWPLALGVSVTRMNADDRVHNLAVPGTHNEQNASLALAAARAISDASPDRLADAIRTFPGLPHRLQRLGTSGGLTYFDDSKSTTPDATRLALAAFESGDQLRRVHLIAGGYDKGIDLAPIVLESPRLAGTYCIGDTASALAGAAPEHTKLCRTLEQAMHDIRQCAQPGDIVLLSPGCASWDQFEHFEARGKAFAALAGCGGDPCDDLR